MVNRDHSNKTRGAAMKEDRKKTLGEEGKKRGGGEGKREGKREVGDRKNGKQRKKQVGTGC